MDAFTRIQLITLAVAENAPHGLSYSSADRIDRAADLLVGGYTNTSVSGMLGLSPQQVSGIKREVDARARLDSLGIEEPKRMSATTLRALAGPERPPKLFERCVRLSLRKELVDLADDAKFTGTEVNALAKEAREAAAAGSDADAAKVIADRRVDLTQHISQIATGGQSRPTPAGRLSKATKACQELCVGTSFKTYRDHTTNAVDTAEAIITSLKCLQGILDAQDQGAIDDAKARLGMP